MATPLQVIPVGAVPIEVRRLTETGTGTETETGNTGRDPRGMGVSIGWSTGEQSELASALLREKCPCATCNARRGDSSHEKPLVGKKAALQVLKATLDEETDLKAVWPVGNYALGFRFADGHDSGIFSYSLLRELSNEV